jgi:hypothetical protein
MGAVKPAPAIKTDDDWQREATLSAIAAARSVITGDGINQRAMIGSLSELEWGWIVAAAVFEWIKKRAEQATAEGSDMETTIRTMRGRDPEPWEAGAVASILPALGNIPDLDWSRPIGEWHKDKITSFAWQIYKLTDAALAARDEGATDKIVKFNRAEQEREVSAKNGGPYMDRREMNDEIPF